MSFKAHYESAGPKDEVPVQEFMDRIPPEIVLELCVVAVLSFFVSPPPPRPGIFLRAKN
jgi:transcription elongation factor B subunit 1